MNYRHAYHAGNFADVFKHVILIALINALRHKENPLCYIDTHAGSGIYDLFSPEAQKTKEFARGISKIMQQQDPPALVKQYIHCVQTINNRLNNAISSLRYYPGSPAILKYFLRAQDRLLLTELQPQEYQLLKKNFLNYRQISIQLLDGYQALKAALPPKERRGLILIDPAYERPDELNDLIAALSVALKKFETGTYAIWYPIKDSLSVMRFLQKINKSISRPHFTVELSVYSESNPTQLNGSGMLIINPPWQVDQHIQACLPWLWKTLAFQGQGQYAINNL